MPKLMDQILFMANEDYIGLWEVYEETKDLHGELPQQDLIKLAISPVLKLIDLGLIQLYWCKEPLTNDKVTPIDISQIPKVLSDNKYWEQPEKESTSVRFIATLEGEKVFAKKFLR